MGNVPPAPSKKEPLPPPPNDDGYVWPENLYAESRDMVAAAFFAYTFGYILDVGRKEGLTGLSVDAEGHGKKDESPLELERSFAPAEVKKLIQENEEKLAHHYPDHFSGFKLEQMLANLDKLEERSRLVGEEVERPLTLEEYYDKHQNQEMVYAVCKDSVNKRITLVFRGTETSLAFKTNLLADIYILKKGVEVPAAVKEKVNSDKIWFHSGFYNYVFGKTARADDAEDKRKYDEILEDIKFLLKRYPDYKLFVTGHSLGAALASMVSFFLCCEEEIPKPVTCLNFASPRMGDKHFLEAVQALEEEGKMRFVRIVNENDSIAVVPTVGYHHGGIQARLYKPVGTNPEITYTKKNEDWNCWLCRAWGNSLPVSFNVSYDHGVGDYQERLEKDQKELEKYQVNQLYASKEWTGFA